MEGMQIKTRVRENVFGADGSDPTTSSTFYYPKQKDIEISAQLKGTATAVKIRPFFLENKVEKPDRTAVAAYVVPGAEIELNAIDGLTGTIYGANFRPTYLKITAVTGGSDADNSASVDITGLRD